MGIIKSDVRDIHLAEFPEEEQLLSAFRTGFDVNWARRRKAYNTDLSVYFLGPEQFMADTFGFDHEIMLVVSDYDTIEPRTMQAVESFFGDEPARGRVDQSIFFLLTRASDGRDWVTTYTTRNPQSRIPVVFSTTELRAADKDGWLTRNLISEQLFARDLYDYQLPLDSDLFFFGRDQVIADNLDAIRRSQNRGLFGLRKTGKTSILYKLKRLVERDGLGCVLYYDCKLPSIRNMRWNELLQRVINDVSAHYKVQARQPEDARQIPDVFIDLLRRLPSDGTTTLIFDEIEYISPLTLLDEHWRKDFVPFWQSLWAAQSQVRRLSNIVAGVNPTVVEIDTVDGVQNPMFGIIQPRYLRGFEVGELRQLVRFFGKRMGIRFAETVYPYLLARYGGHPLLTRLACSQLNADLLVSRTKRPVDIDAAMLRRSEDARDSELIFYCRHVVSELKQFYPDEYEMLELLASGRVVDFMDLQVEPQFTRHLREYGLVTIDNVGRPRFAIPVIGRYIGAESARKEGRRLRRHVVPISERALWVQKRVEVITRELRSLEALIGERGGPVLYGPTSFPEAERFSSLKPCATQDDFVTFINICNRCLVEAVEKTGRQEGIDKYFWTTIKTSLPDLWEALHRIKVYRHNDLHLNLNPVTQAELTRYLDEDLERRRIGQVDDVWFVLQECVLDCLFVAVQCEINRLS